MNLYDLQATVAGLIAAGFGQTEVVTTPENFNPGYRMQCFWAGIREAKIQGEGFWVYNLRDEPRVQVFELCYAGPKTS